MMVSICAILLLLTACSGVDIVERDRTYDYDGTKIEGPIRPGPIR